jgi:hypothetical protein
MIVQIYLTKQELSLAIHQYLEMRDLTLNHVPTPREIAESVGFGSRDSRLVQIEIDTEDRK